MKCTTKTKCMDTELEPLWITATTFLGSSIYPSTVLPDRADVQKDRITKVFQKRAGTRTGT